MKIDQVGSSQLIKNYRKQKKQTQKTKRNRKSDQLSLSGEAKQLQKLKQKIDYTPQVRQEKVAKLKKEVAQGTYEVDGSKVSEKILQELINKQA